jgi:hypothetical protein
MLMLILQVFGTSSIQPYERLSSATPVTSLHSIHWASKLQMKKNLRITESEYIALRMATRELLLIQCLLQEVHTNGITSLTLLIITISCELLL